MPPTPTLITYDAEEFSERELKDVSEVEAVLDEPGVHWLHVQGEPEEALLRQLGAIFHLHLLALEDVINGIERPKAEEYDGQDFIVMHTVQAHDHHLSFHQFSLFVGRNYVLSFHAGPDAAAETIRIRIRTGRGIIRRHGVDYLMYALLDAITDNYFPVLEDVGEHLDYIQEEALLRENPRTMSLIQRTKHELLHLRRVIWPVRDLLTTLLRDDNDSVSEPVRHYLRDCYDHIIQLMDMLEIYREMASDLMDAYLSALSHRMNSVMKVLTIIATVFMPLTFIVGVYGMNFRTDASRWNMPELTWGYGYLFVWSVMLLSVVFMLTYFWRRGWIGRSDLPAPEEHRARRPTKRPRMRLR
jgi:magnesium transporter